MIILFSYVFDMIVGKFVVGLFVIFICFDGCQVIVEIDVDGCCKQWVDIQFEDGIYQLCFYCKDYLVSMYGELFYLFVDIYFIMVFLGNYYYVFLLILLFGFSSYWGSQCQISS